MQTKLCVLQLNCREIRIFVIDPTNGFLMGELEDKPTLILHQATKSTLGQRHLVPDLPNWYLGLVNRFVPDHTNLRDAAILFLIHACNTCYAECT